jgi:hypothetical protein
MRPERASPITAHEKSIDPEFAAGSTARVASGAAKVVVPLLLGLACYMFFRPDSRFYLGYGIRLPVAGELIANLPDGFWAYSFCQALFLCPGSRPLRDSVTVFLFGVIYELLQGVLIPGRPSELDLAYYALATSTAFLLHSKNSPHEH